MKKLSFILALVLVLTCGVLAACGDETETSSEAAESGEAKTESSAAAEDSSETAVESSEADDSSAPADESSEADVSDVSVPEAATDNLAAGKSYTVSKLFGQDQNWQYDPNAAPAYPDEGGVTLTDGILPAEGASYTVAEWVGFNSNYPEYTTLNYHWITLDLGESKDLAKYVLNYGTKALDNGIGAPNSVEVLVSEDGETWNAAIGSAVPANDAGSVNESVVIEGAATGRYVQFRFVSNGWAFISEIEVYAAAE